MIGWGYSKGGAGPDGPHSVQGGRSQLTCSPIGTGDGLGLSGMES